MLVPAHCSRHKLIIINFRTLINVHTLKYLFYIFLRRALHMLHGGLQLHNRYRAAAIFVDGIEVLAKIGDLSGSERKGHQLQRSATLRSSKAFRTSNINFLNRLICTNDFNDCATSLCVSMVAGTPPIGDDASCINGCCNACAGVRRCVASFTSNYKN